MNNKSTVSGTTGTSNGNIISGLTSGLLSHGNSLQKTSTFDNRCYDSHNETMQTMPLKKSVGRNGINHAFQDVSMSTMRTLGGNIHQKERVPTMSSTEIERVNNSKCVNNQNTNEFIDS